MQRKPECCVICPVCGMRLAFEEGVCFCPGEYCDYKCDACLKGIDFVLEKGEVDLV